MAAVAVTGDLPQPLAQAVFRQPEAFSFRDRRLEVARAGANGARRMAQRKAGSTSYRRGRRAPHIARAQPGGPRILAIAAFPSLSCWGLT